MRDSKRSSRCSFRPPFRLPANTSAPFFPHRELVVERERTQADQQTISSLNEELAGKSAQLEDLEWLRSLAEQQQETSVRYEKLCVDVEDLERFVALSFIPSLPFLT